MAVGDVHSAARGSGARYNDGKPALELLPLRVLAESLWRSDLSPEQNEALAALVDLAEWQETGAVGALYSAIAELGYPWDECAAVFEYGKRKYAAWNWSKGMAWSIPLACAARHLRSIIRGESIDPVERGGSGLPHVGHAMCNLAMLITFHRTYPEGDDRPRNLAPAPIADRIPAPACSLACAPLPAPGPVVPLVPVVTPLIKPLEDEEPE